MHKEREQEDLVRPISKNIKNDRHLESQYVQKTVYINTKNKNKKTKKK